MASAKQEIPDDDPKGLEIRRKVSRFDSREDVIEFFRACAALEGPETEPDWKEHLRVMSESRSSGFSAT